MLDYLCIGPQMIHSGIRFKLPCMVICEIIVLRCVGYIVLDCRNIISHVSSLITHIHT